MDSIDFFGITLPGLLFKILFLLIVVIAAYLLQKILLRVLNRVLKNIEELPSATIVTNILTGVIWGLALLIVLEPVFGIDPTGFIAALGVSSLVVSLGLKDTISNLFAGFVLMLGKVIQPGDHVIIAGTTGDVTDVTMRHTVIQTRGGDHVVIPNSVLNTSSIVSLSDLNEAAVSIDVMIDVHADPKAVTQDVLATVRQVAASDLMDDIDPKFLYDALTPQGARCRVVCYVKPGVGIAGVRNSVVQALLSKPYLSNMAAPVSELV